MDIFLTAAFQFSTKSQKTQETYKYWVLRLLRYTKKPHPLDVSPEDIKHFYLSFHDYAYSTRTLIRSALLYFYTVLCYTETPEIYHYPHAAELKKLFAGPRTHAYTLPDIATHAHMARFCDALPDTTTGNILKEMYQTGHTFQRVLDELPVKIFCSHQYAQQIAAKTARDVGIPHGFGLRGIRASGLCHRIQTRKDDMELVEIFKDSHLSYQQFRLYRKAAGEINA